MKYRVLSLRFGDFRASRPVGRLCAWARLGVLLLLWAAWPADAALRTWTGAGPNAFWSTAANWNPSGVPQNGEDLAFPANGPQRTNSNDLTARTFGFILFNGPKSDYEIHGNGITLSGGLSAVNTGPLIEDPQIVFDIALASDLRFVADGAGIGFGRIGLAGHTLTLNTTTSNSHVFAGGEISGVGDVIKIGVGDALYGGPDGNTYQGSTFVSEGTLRIGKGNGGAPYGVPGPLVIGDLDNFTFGLVSLLDSEMINNAASITINHGALDLNGWDQTVGPVAFYEGSINNNSNAGTLTLRGPVSQPPWAFDRGGSISGRVSLPGIVVFDLRAPGDLSLNAAVSGPGGIIKEGFGKLTMYGSNAVSAFSGPLTVNDGTLYFWDCPRALEGISGLTLNNSGVVGLREVSFANKSLTMTSPNTGLYVDYQTCTWNGPIHLDFTGMAKFNNEPDSLGSLRLLGSIQGTGGIWFGGGPIELLTGNTFTGPVRSACSLLTLNTGGGRPFSGALEVGGAYLQEGGFGPFSILATNSTAEVRWFRDHQNPNQPLTVRSNGFVNLNGHSEDFAGITFHGGLVIADAGTVTLNGPVTVQPENATAVLDGNIVLPGTVTFAVSNTLVNVGLNLDGTIVGNGGITKTGPGELQIDADGSYSGPVVVNQGELLVSSSTALGTRTAGTTVNVGGTLVLGSGAGFLGEPLTLAGGGSEGTNGAVRSFLDIFITNNVVLNGPTTIRTEGINSRIQILGVISGTGPLTKVGLGVFGFRGDTDNTYSGDTFASEGTMRLTKASGITSVPGHLIVGGAGPSATVEQGASFTIIGSVTVNRGSLWNLNGFSESFTVSALGGRPPLTLNGGGDVQTGAGTLMLPTSGDVVVDPAGVVLASSLISGNLGLEPGPHRFIVQSGPTVIGIAVSELNITANISQLLAAADIVKEGPGAMRLGGSNSFNGAVTVNGGGLIAAHSSALGSAVAGTFVNGNASLGLEGGVNVQAEPLTLDSTNAAALFSLGPVTNVWEGNITLQRTAGIRVSDPGGALTHSGIPGLGTPAPNISGPGGFTKSGPGVLLIAGLGGGNIYTGTTTVTDGLLEAVRGGRSLSSNIVVTGPNSALHTGRAGNQFNSVPTVLPTGASVSVENGALWTMNGTNFETVSRLVGDGRLIIGSGGALTVTNSVSCAFSGAVSGTGALNKRGLATLQVTGQSPSYTGTVTVFDGTYKVDGYFAASPIVVKNSSVLRGSGAVGDVTVENGGVVRVDPANSGVLGGGMQFNSVNFQSGGVLGAQFYGPHPTGGNDLLYVLNGVTLGTPALSSGFQYPPHEGDVVTLIQKIASGPVTGNFSGFPEGALRTIGQIPVVMSYVGGNGNEVTLTVTNLPLRGGGSQIVSGLRGNAFAPNDCSQLWLVVTNGSATTATGLHGFLRSLTPGVVVTIAESAYPNLAPNARGSNATPFQIRTETNFPCGGGVQLELVLTSSNLPPTAILYTFLGPSGDSLQFDGRDDKVEVAANTFSTVANNFTIELWANPTGNRTETAETNAGMSGVSVPLRQLQRFAVFPDRGNLAYGPTHVGAGLSIGGNGISVYEQGTNYLPSRLVYSNAVSGWTHVALVYSSRRPQLYVNGALVRSSSVASPFSSVHPSGSLGGSTQGAFGNFAGQLDEVRIWNTALSQAQIQSNMTHSLTGAEPNLVTYFRCDEGSGSILTDSAAASPNPTGTLMGSTSFVFPGVLPFGPDCDSSGGACESCLVAHGTFTTNTPTLSTPLSPDGSPSLCFPPKPCPGPFPLPLSPTPFIQHSFANTSGIQACVTAQLHFDCPAASQGAMHAAAYLGAFDPNDPCANYLGDSGGDGTAAFSFPVPAGSNVVLLITLWTPGIGCDAYTLELFGLPCASPRLDIAKDNAPNKVLLQWSSAYPEYRLQSVNSLEGPGPYPFNNVASSPGLVSGKFLVTNTVAGPRQFFRLSK